MAQLVTRVDDSLIAKIDRLIEAGAFATRSELVREAIASIIDRTHRETVGRQIIDGYATNPQDASEVGWSDQATAQMIADESW